jgi:hypothetical protein
MKVEWRRRMQTRISAAEMQVLDSAVIVITVVVDC